SRKRDQIRVAGDQNRLGMIESDDQGARASQEQTPPRCSVGLEFLGSAWLTACRARAPGAIAPELAANQPNVNPARSARPGPAGLPGSAYRSALRRSTLHRSCLGDN